jgi:hypothetical protein
MGHYEGYFRCVSVVQCNKPTQRHLRPTCRCPTCDVWWWLCLWCGHVVLTSPEDLLILYKSGIFAIDTSIVNFQTWPRHRDDLWKKCYGFQPKIFTCWCMYASCQSWTFRITSVRTRWRLVQCRSSSVVSNRLPNHLYVLVMFENLL